MLDSKELGKIKRKILSRHYVLVRAVLASALILLFLLVIWGILGFLKKTVVGKYTGIARSFIVTPKNQIFAIDGKTNILVLGKAGEGNIAPDLTDTIMLASVDHENGAIKLVSLPRDIWIEDLRAKLNSVYYWGEEKKEGGGIVLAKSVVEEITGIPVHYAVVVDFSGFSEIINTLGGIEVNVDRSFTDEDYPIPGKEADECEGDPDFLCRYETIHFDAGTQMMDGATALKFVRSRNSKDPEEGTDLARSVRQQRVLASIKNKALSSETLFSFSKLKSLQGEVDNMIETDLDERGLAILARRALEAKDNFLAMSMPEELLINPPISYQYDNLYVFVPRSENWDEIRSWFEDVFANINY